ATVDRASRLRSRAIEEPAACDVHPGGGHRLPPGVPNAHHLRPQPRREPRPALIRRPPGARDGAGLRPRPAGRGLRDGPALHSGNFAALTNVRTRHKRDPATVTSRGRLVEHLACGRSPKLSRYIDEHLLDPFHVVCGNAFAFLPPLSDDPRVQYSWCCPEEDEDGSLVRFATGPVQEVRQGVFVVSNENRAAGSGAWPKCSWLRERVAGFMAALPLAPPPPVEAVHAGIAEIMGQFDVPGIEPPAKLPDHFTPRQEGLLHTGPFCPWRADFPHFGTVSQRVLIRGSGAVRYYHRSTNVGSGEDGLRTTEVRPVGVHHDPHLALAASRS
ncbi:unnamed protein product, partial [Prorocentrum cordatum]